MIKSNRVPQVLSLLLFIVGLVILSSACDNSTRSPEEAIATFEADPNAGQTKAGARLTVYGTISFEVTKSPITSICYELVRYRTDIRSTTSTVVDCKYYQEVIE